MKNSIRTATLLIATVLTALPASSQWTARSGARPARTQDRLQVGDLAPDFRLKTKEGKTEIQLSKFQRKRPVVLVFGSYT